MENISNEKIQCEEVNFKELDDYDLKIAKYFKPEANKPYVLIISGIRIDIEKIVDKETGVEKELPCLKLSLTSINDIEVQQEWTVFSKNLRQTIREYYNAKNLIGKKFNYRKTGDGKTTKHFLTFAGDGVRNIGAKI